MRKHLFWSLIAVLFVSISAQAGWNFQSNKKYYFSCNYASGFISLGAYQGSAYDIFYQTNSTTPTDDGYWYITTSGSGYAIQNCKTGQFLSWTSAYDPNRYLALVDEVSSDDQRWTINNCGDYVTIQSVSQPSYYFNMRTGTYLVGLYASTNIGENGQFHIYDSDGIAATYSSEQDEAIWDQSKRYALYNANGYGYAIYNPDFSDTYPCLGGYTSGKNGCNNDIYKQEVDTTLANNQWSVLHDSNGYYLYNVGKGQYISNSNTYGQYYYFTNVADPFEVTEVREGVYAFRLVSQSSNSNAYLCAASQNEGSTSEGWPVAYWKLSDAGSEWQLIEVGTTNVNPDGDSEDDETTTWGYNTTATWDGEGDSHTFPNWTSNNAGEDNTTSNYYVNATVSGEYLISFNWTVSCESYYDYFTATLDGATIIEQQSGSLSGTYSQSHNLSSGTHQLIFTYSKDNMMSSYSDNASVRNLTFTKIVKVESIAVTAEKTDLNQDEKVQLTATVSPSNANDSTVTWSSSNNNVVTVTSEGLVTAIDPGTATVTATANDGSGVTGSINLTVIDPYLTHGDEMLYVRHRDSTVVIIPKDYITTYDYRGSLFTSTLVDGQSYDLTGIIEVTEEAPADLPAFSVYKFNNKFNSQLFTDAISSDPNAATINLEVGCIGKWLTASFQFTNEATKAYVNGVRQRSKKTRQSFASPVTYLLTNSNWQRLKIRQDTDGSYVRKLLEFNRKVTVNVDFLADHPTSEYGVPRIDITLANTDSWSSENWIGMNGKSTYEDATITIDGAGVYPDMEATPILIKGRGNTSWSSSYHSKNPYHFKFTSKQKPLGMTKGKHWILLSNKQSGSMTSNAMGHKVGNMMQTAGTNHIVPVELYINGSYRGTYDLTERLGFSNNSIDLADETYAAMIELDTYTDETIYSTNAYSLPAKIHIPEIGEDSTVLDAETIMYDFDNMTSVLPMGDDSYLHYIDAEYLARYLATCEFIVQREISHPKSVFLYSENVTDGFNSEGDDETPWIFGPLWDCDWSFGYEKSYTYYINNAESDFYNNLLDLGSNSTNTKNFWKALRFNSTEISQQTYQLWYNFMNKGGLEELIDYCDEYYQFAGNAFLHNKNNETSNADSKDYAEITENCKEWFTKRANYIYKKLTPYDITEEEEDDEIVNSDNMGDVNDDNAITTSDVVCVLNSLTNLPNETYYAARADMNSSGEVSISDVVLLCNLVLEQPASVKRNIHLPSASISMRMNSIVAESQSEVMLPINLCADEGAYSALQMDVQLPEGVELNSVKLPADMAQMTVRTRLMENGRYRIALYADGSYRLPESITTLQLQLITGQASEGYVTLTGIMATTSEGEEERMASRSCRLTVKDNETTGIAATENKLETKQTAIYDLSGRRIGGNSVKTHGVYIINGKKVIK